MEKFAINEHLMRKYLLGELAERELERLEERLLTDDSFYQTLTALEDEVEDELIDEYLDGDLTRPERENFERVFLNTPERVDKLRLVKDLKDHALVSAAGILHAPADVPAKHDEAGASRRRWIPAFAAFQNPLVGLSCAAALLLTVLVGGWLLVKTNRLESELRQAEALKQLPPPADSNLKEQLEQLRLRNEELTASLRQSEEQRASLDRDFASLKSREGSSPATEKTKPRSPRTFIASVIVSATLRGASVGEKLPTLTLHPGVTQARVVIKVEGVGPKDYKSLRAVVKKRGGEEIWHSDGVSLRASGNTARAVLPLSVERLTEGLYVVELDGISSDGSTEPVGIYSFRVRIK
jgi:hypothetical protein